MYIRIYKEDVIEGLQKAASIIPQKSGAAYLRSIWLKVEGDRLEIFSTDSNIEFRGNYIAEVMEGGLIGVQGRAFVELLRRLPAGQISLQTDKDSPVLHIIQGRRKYKLATNDVTWFQNFSDFPDEGAVIWSGEYLQNIIDKIVYCLADESMDAMACMIMKPTANKIIEVAGMNGHQFSMINIQHDDLLSLLPEEGILIQKKYVIEIKKWLGLNEIEVNINDKRLFLRTEDKKESMSIPLSSYTYPDYHAFLKKISDGSSTLSLKKSEAEEALMRINIFNTESNRCTYMSLSSKEAILSTAGQDIGSAVEMLDIEYSGDIEKIAFHTSNLLSIFDHFSSSRLTLVFTGAEGPCAIRGEDDLEYLVIIMPMKILEDMQFSEEQV